MSSDGIRFIRNEEFWMVLGPFIVVFGLSFCFVFLDSVINDYGHHFFYEYAIMIPVMTIVISVIACISHIISGPVLLGCVFLMLRYFDRVPLISLLAIVPILGLLTWFGYDRLVPDYRWYTDERPDYEHGLTLLRYLEASGFDLTMVAIYWLPLRKYRPHAQVAA